MNYYKLTNSLLTKFNQLTINAMTVRSIQKHKDPKWKKLRKAKVIKVDLSYYEKRKEDELSSEYRTKKMKERGIYPQKPWQEKPIYISCTNAVFEAYVPPEGDGKFSAMSAGGAKQNVEYLTKKSKSYRAVRTIRKYEDAFKAEDFAVEATDIYIKAHDALAKKNKQEIIDYVTENLFPDMFFNLENKIVSWKFIKSLEPAKVVHARSTTFITETNTFAQVTVRFHTQQKLAIYDRFGRLMNGSEILAKDVLEYIVFEKHLSNQYGRWRLHSKIIPPWMPPPASIQKTYVLKD